jgi:hypothetical protein
MPLSRKTCTLNALIKVERLVLFVEFKEFGLDLVTHGYLANLEAWPTFLSIKEAPERHAMRKNEIGKAPGSWKMLMGSFGFADQMLLI